MKVGNKIMFHIYLHHDIFTVDFVGILNLCFSFF